MSTEFPKQWNVETLMQIFAVRPDLLEEFDRRRPSLPAAPVEAAATAWLYEARHIDTAWVRCLSFERPVEGAHCRIVAALITREKPTAVKGGPVEAVVPSVNTDICLPNGAMFDWSGEPRTKRVRLTFDGAHLILNQKEADAYLEELDADCRAEYTLSDVYLSEREFDDLPEFDGF